MLLSPLLPAAGALRQTIAFRTHLSPRPQARAGSSATALALLVSPVVRARARTIAHGCAALLDAPGPATGDFASRLPPTPQEKHASHRSESNWVLVRHAALANVQLANTSCRGVFARLSPMCPVRAGATASEVQGGQLRRRGGGRGGRRRHGRGGGRGKQRLEAGAGPVALSGCRWWTWRLHLRAGEWAPARRGRLVAVPRAGGELGPRRTQWRPMAASGIGRLLKPSPPPGPAAAGAAGRRGRFPDGDPFKRAQVRGAGVRDGEDGGARAMLAGGLCLCAAAPCAQRRH